ncbi:MAG TPA: hypothetical protein VN258_02515 [Mobilitalea sp.]|nr:hypothetical protein [Mobilitalea sp.]
MTVEDKKSDKGNIIINIIMFCLFVLIDLLSYTVFYDTGNAKYFFRMIARGIFGALLFYDSMFLLLTTRQSFLCKNATVSKRKLCGILIGIVGAIMIITAFLGYGRNGDPRYIWWE